MTSNHDALTTEEVASLLKVSKLTVYDLIKKGTLPSYRVGRQIRVEREALENYKNQGQPSKPAQTGRENSGKPSVIITGQDYCLDLLAKQLENEQDEYRALRSHIGSLNGLINMYLGKADIVSTHLFDGESNSYNTPYVKKILVNHSFMIIRLLKRQAGLFVQKGNPKGIQGWKDLADSNIAIVNREAGSGARTLLDEQLRLHDIVPDSISGYHNVLTSHIDVANAIINQNADVGIGAKHAAKMINIDFVKMTDESYDIVILATDEHKPLIKQVLAITNDGQFKNKLANLGFNTNETGKVIYEQ